MTTLREALQAEIVQAKISLSEKETRLAQLEGTFRDALERDVDELRSFFRSVGHHIFGQSVTAKAPDVQHQIV